VQLERALERIEKEDVAKNEFIATLAHELRNPLAPVVSALDLLTLQHPSEEAMQTIEVAQRELGVMRRLLDDILDVARIAQTRFRLQKEVVDIRPLLERCVESTKNFLRNRKHTLTITLPDSPVMVEVDPVRFQQVIVNLLNNAGKYTESGGRIELWCEKAGTRAKIQVRDNGIGIPQESLNEIFEPFRQIRPTPQIGTGLGIGLWLTKRLVEMQGGTIEVQSEGAELGSCFTIYLPLQNVLRSETQEKMRVTALVIPSLKILVADDNEAAAQAMQKLLKLKGHDSYIAYDGVSAISKVAEISPDVVLLDIGLPDMSGHDVAQTLRKMRTKATLIALTGYGQEEDKERAKKAGFDYHLTKPVGIVDIERVLAQIRS
jgi:CheY-like chemotaxis protein